MASVVSLLQLSPTMSEGTLMKWLVKEGDVVKSAQPIAEVETDKAVMEQESFEDATVLKLLVGAGSKVGVGSAIAVLGQKGEDISSVLAGIGVAAAKAAAPAPAPPAKPAPAAKPAAAPVAPAAPAPAAPAPAPAAASNGGRVFASPLAKKIAKESGLDLAAISGTGPQGRVIKRDVELALVEGPKVVAPAAAVAPSAGEGDEIVPLSGMRQTIARRLLESKQTIPHFQLTIEVRCERVLDAVERVRAAYPDSKVTVTHFLIKAMAMTMMRHKAIRSQWGGDHLRVVNAGHVSCAVAIEEGLVTPVIRNAHAKGVLKIAEELRELAGLARARKLTAADMTGGCQTISNLGMFGIHEFTAIINPPESTILAVGGVEERPVVEKGQIVAGKVMTITMSCDHRVVDGAVGSQYLADLKKSLEDPLMMLL